MFSFGKKRKMLPSPYFSPVDYETLTVRDAKLKNIAVQFVTILFVLSV